jgi:hypothetical protein
MRGSRARRGILAGVVSTRPKYGNRRANGFDSQREARRHQDLLLLEHAGKIRHLTRQVKFDIFVNGAKVCAYTADFTYFDNETNEHVVEDAKGYATTVYRLKKKLMKAVFDITIREV